MRVIVSCIMLDGDLHYSSLFADIFTLIGDLYYIIATKSELVMLTTSANAPMKLNRRNYVYWAGSMEVFLKEKCFIWSQVISKSMVWKLLLRQF